jgi:tetratricopeptide (TPR) repeat protein
LGNTYRQLGRLDDSYEVLTKALDLRPSDPFPLYGIGRTLLVKGLYAEAADILNRALAAGAPPLVALDRAEALYRQGVYDQAQALLVAHRALATEPHRVLMADYLLYRLGAGDAPARSRVEAGLPYWQDHARRFHDTVYGQSLLEDVRHLETLVQEE